MRHRKSGRYLGRNASHRRAMFRNMATSLVTSARPNEDDPQKPKVAGRIITTVEKAKELRPRIEKLITLAKKALPHLEAAEQFATSAQKNTPEWKEWRKSDRWKQWVQAISPAVALRRRAFAALRDKAAVEILFDDLAPRYRERPGGYTRIVRLAEVRLGDAGRKALIEFVGENDRRKAKKRTAPVVRTEETVDTAAEAPAAEG